MPLAAPLRLPEAVHEIELVQGRPDGTGIA
jgi:hypothetical protein